MNDFLKLMTSDIAIIIYISLGLIAAAAIWIIFKKKSAALEEEQERSAINRQYSDLKRTLKNKRR